MIMIINEAFRNLSVSLEAGSSKLQQIDVAIEEAAVDMGASAFKTFFKVVLPLISSALAGRVHLHVHGGDDCCQRGHLPDFTRQQPGRPLYSGRCRAGDARHGLRHFHHAHRRGAGLPGCAEGWWESTPKRKYY